MIIDGLDAKSSREISTVVSKEGRKLTIEQILDLTGKYESGVERQIPMPKDDDYLGVVISIK